MTNNNLEKTVKKLDKMNAITMKGIILEINIIFIILKYI